MPVPYTIIHRAVSCTLKDINTVMFLTLNTLHWQNKYIQKAKVGKAIKNAGAMNIYNIRQFPAHKTLKLTTKIRSMLIMLSKLPLPSACVSSATEQLPP